MPSGGTRTDGLSPGTSELGPPALTDLIGGQVQVLFDIRGQHR